MAVIAGIFWYLIVFETNGALMALPTPHQSAQACEAAMEESRQGAPSSWEFQCVEPQDQWAAPAD
jgi:hypothetical protein